jgi:hypothetical protein
MQECEAGTGKSSFVKRVTVRSGGAGHAHSGVVKVNSRPSGNESNRSAKTSDGKIVRLGR